ncbi:unnamed protein product [Parnassius mnemosyne]|uniref:DDE Tnp4 domain-containing protein n=1 Tax=Parnassius mnemosyne TaxID=213953 RepID=A0AAV1LYI0_9NEOP
MCTKCFDYILDLIKNDIQKQHTNWREPIGPEERLVVTLRYLATGDSFGTIGHSYHIGFSTVSVIIEEVCEAIWKRLQPIYMREPTLEDWEVSISGFYEKWQFPNCCGSIDGKHVTVKCPDKTGSNYFSYLRKFSFVLLAIVGPDYKFISIDVGGYGKNSDGGIFEESVMGRKLADGTFNIPSSRPLNGQNVRTPCVLIGDQAFALSSYMMRPYPEAQARYYRRKEKFNSILGSASRVVENAFGILSSKWYIFHRPMETKVTTSITVVKAACVLHNFLIERKAEHINNPIEEQFEHALEDFSLNNRRSSNYAFLIREQFADYFNTHA